VLKPLISWLLPQIRAAQDEGALPKVEPIILHYLLISLTSTLSGFGSEMQATANISSSDPAVVDAYWSTVEALVFNQQAPSQRSKKSQSGPGDANKQPRVSGRSRAGG
jgi:hypothetical protein